MAETERVPANRKRKISVKIPMAEQKSIPADLHEEILHRLPSNDLHNFKRVCRSWNELISSQRFIQKHQRRSNRTLIFTLFSNKILICDDPTGNKIGNKIRRRISGPIRKRNAAPIRKLIGRRKSKIGRCIPYPPGFTRFSVDNMRIAGSCDGLVCLVADKSNEFAIINAGTGRFEVGTTDGFLFEKEHRFWFGHHPSTGEYLIVKIPISSNIIDVYRFSPGTLTSLQRCAIPWNNFSFDWSPILSRGALHWSAFKIIDGEIRVVILVYNIVNNSLREISTPFADLSRVRIGIVDGCLFVIRRSFNFELWIMKEYGVRRSWSKCRDLEGFQGCMELYPLGFLPDGDIVLECGKGKLVKYCFRERKGSVLDVYAEDDYRDVEANTAFLCADSLVSPTVVWGN